MTEKVYDSDRGLILTLRDQRLQLKAKFKFCPWCLARNALWISLSDILKKTKKTGYFKIIASAIWFTVFQSNLEHLFSGPFLLPQIIPQGFAWIFLEIL